MTALRIEGKDLVRARIPEDLREVSLHTLHGRHMDHLHRLAGLPLEAMELRWFSAPDLTAVPVPPTLRHLHVWHSSKLRSLAGLERARGLEHLALEDNGPLEDAGALAALPRLRSLAILGGMNAKQKIRTLGFLEGLRLDRLVLRGVQGVSDDLGPVLRMKTLRTLDLWGPDFEPRELARVAAAHPGFCARLMDVKDEAAWANCKRCGGPRKLLFLRRRKGLWCPRCEAAGWTRALEEFRATVDAARRELDGEWGA